MSDIRCEWGSIQKLRFADIESKMIDGEGKEMLCKCGKPASGGAFGKEAFILWCKECDQNVSDSSIEYRLVYTPITGNEDPILYKKLPFFRITDWEILKNKEDADDKS